MSRSNPTHFLIMGVAGTGKSTIGSLLSEQMGLDYIDGDALHTENNIKKMSMGQALDDDDRWPWLKNCADALKQSGGAILGCSALKRRYRDFLRDEALPVHFQIICLIGSPELIAERMDNRKNHFMPRALLESQFASFEPPAPNENAIIVDIDQPQGDIVDEILTSLRKPA